MVEGVYAYWLANRLPAKKRIGTSGSKKKKRPTTSSAPIIGMETLPIFTSIRETKINNPLSLVFCITAPKTQTGR